MPNYDVTVDGKPRKIELIRKDEMAFVAKIDGKSHLVEWPSQKTERTMTIGIDGKGFKVEMPELERDKPVLMKVEETVFRIEIKTPIQKQTEHSFEPTHATSAKRASISKQSSVEGAVTAPMTGKIISIRVRKGDRIKVNQVLCVIEAMKMENEITAAKAGVVQEVIVSEGQGVNEGDTLLAIG